ncbi:MAG: UbiA family prenyltransferase [Spirochaetes bacterium]|nr:UbiA family prenyltransferase [Spirochaetota bacterium]
MSQKIFRNIFRLKQIILCLSLAYTGLLFSGGSELLIWLLVTAGVIFAKAAHLCFYKIMDIRGIYKSPRYRERLIAKGQMKNVSLWLCAIFASAVFITSCFFISQLCYYIAIGAVAVMLFFPLLKRYSSLPYYYMGVFESACPVAGFIAGENRYEHIALVLALSVFFWVIGQEICRAGFEIAEDTEQKSFSIPARFGIDKARVFSIFFYLISIAGFTAAGIMNKRGLTYWISIICFLIIFIRQETLLKAKDPETAKIEFIQINNFIAPVIFIGTIIDVFYGV